MTGGGKLLEVSDRKGTLYGRIDYSEALVFTSKDAQGNFLLGAPKRERVVEDIGSFAAHVQEQESGDMGGLSPTQAWFRLGLIDWEGKPTRRGRIFSFFNYGEGLAIASALEEKSYEISELVFDLANLRAGHRFGDFESFSSRLGNVCRATYGNVTFEGYLEKGMPSDYGEGAAEVLVQYEAQNGVWSGKEGAPLGDVERVRLEWISFTPAHYSGSGFRLGSLACVTVGGSETTLQPGSQTKTGRNSAFNFSPATEDRAPPAFSEIASVVDLWACIF